MGRQQNRGRLTWTIFAALASFGVLNAGLGPALLFAAASVGQLLGPLLVAPLAEVAGFRIAFLALVGYALVGMMALVRHRRGTAVR